MAVRGQGNYFAAFPKQNWGALCAAAHRRGVKRAEIVATSANYMRDSIRRRCQEHGILIRKLGTEIGSTGYFSNVRIKGVDYNKIAAAVEFFGGKLVIDWQDE